MRFRLVSFALLLLVAGSLTLSLIRGQERPPAPPGVPAAPAKPAPAAAAPAAPPAAAPAAKPAPPRDFSRLTPLGHQFLLAARRGADWLYRMNGVKGRFQYGYVPALKAELEGDHYLRQAGAAFALARAARFTGEERYAARATQAVLALLDETATDPKDPAVRFTALPPGAVNRLGAAGLLVLAINELPAPQSDLLEKSEQLCNYVRRQARPDGSLAPAEGEAAADPEGVNYYPGEALYGLLRSHRLRPAAWKVELARKALAYYRPWWRANRNMAFVPWQSAAYAEAFAVTREAAFGDFVLELNDWICQWQYAQIDPRRLLWYGGFMGFAGGRAVESAPQVGCVAYAEGLAQACRVTRERGDLARHQRYSETAERCLQFLESLQYTEANTQHFADWYRPRVVGAFHASHQDGNVRIDYTQHAVSALVLYLEHVAR
jgi:hypothetical protein